MKRDFKGVWIPKEIWLDNQLSWMEKLFIVEINSLDNEEGCYASNSYLGEFFNLSNGRVSQIIKSLIEKQYLSAEYEMEGKEVKKRYLRILNTGIKNIKQGGIKNSKGGIKNSKEGYLENDKDNNTVFNNTFNNTKESERVEEHTHTPKAKVKKEKPSDEGDIVEQLEEFVKMKRKEYKKLIELYNEEVIEEYIKKLDNYKGAKGKTYKNDYRAILIWLDRDKIKPKVKNVI